MKKQSPSPSRAVKSGQFVLTSKRGERISAVEGLQLTPRMRKAMTASVSRGLSGDERRAQIRDIVRKK